MKPKPLRILRVNKNKQYRWFILILILLFASLPFIRFTEPSTTRPPIMAAEPSITVAFSPENGAGDLVVKLIAEAKRSIRVAAYSFTSKPIAEALVNAHKRGVDVQVVLDKSQKTEKYTSATFMANMGIPIRINSNYAIMHNKFIIVDDVSVETGSFNYTKAAEMSNAENVLVLHDHPDIANLYRKEWQKLWNEAEDYAPKY